MHLAIAAVAATLLLPAHASVIGSTPGDGDVVTAQPGTFSVVMNEEILAIDGADSSNVIQLTDAAGLFYGDGCTTVDGESISLDAELGAAGDYTLTYQLVSADGHAVSDAVEFAFEPEAGAEVATGAEATPVCGESIPVAEEPAGSEAVGPAASEATAPSEQNSSEGDDGAAFPVIASGALVLLVVLGGAAFLVRRFAQRRGERNGGAEPGSPGDDGGRR